MKIERKSGKWLASETTINTNEGRVKKVSSLGNTKDEALKKANKRMKALEKSDGQLCE